MSTDLASALVNLVADLEPRLLTLIAIACYLLALIAFAVGLLRLLKYSEDKFHAPTIAGSVLCFLICAILVTLPSWIDAAGESLFAGARTATAASLGYGGRGADWNALLDAVFRIVGLVGLVAAIRGVFMMRAAADGKQGATAGRAALHILGGICCWHVVPLIQAVQTTLGIRVLQIS